MCSIDKMLIKGIRSFSPDNDHAIVFPKPLTLIVGRNGAGKTTVIECLKMATTGELPPSARAGQAFIHDPKVADVTEVKAQIKLRFRDVRKQPCVVTRSFQLTQKSGGKLEKKDLDQVIQTLDEKTGERVSVSRKCADINATVPDMMGVSKAILENVVFVHQEDSNWPLGESANLKKKFDEIFSATKYTKALEHINKLKKDQAISIKEFKLKVETLRVQKDHAVRIKTQHEENSSKAAVLSQRMVELGRTIAEAQRVISTCDGDIVGLRSLAVEHGKLEARRETIISENARKYGNLSHVLEDGLEALQEIYETYNDRVVTQKHDLEAHDRQSTDLLNQLGALKERRERDVRLHGKSTAESEAQAKRLSDRAKNLAEIVGQHPEIGPLPPDLAAVAAANGAGATIDDPAAVAAAEEVRGRAHSRLKQLAAAAANLRAKNRREDDAAGAEVDIASRALAAAEESMRLRNEQRNAKRARADEVSADLSALSVSDASVAELKQRMAGAERDFEDRRCAGTSANVAAEIEAKAEEVIALERKLAKLRSEAAAAAAAGENALKMRLKREELFGKEDQCKTLLESRAGRLASVFGGAAAVPAAAQLKPALRTVIDTRVRAMDASRVDAGNASSAARNAASGLAAAMATAERLQGEVADAEARAAAEGDLLPEPPGTPALSQVPRSRFAAYASAVTESDAAVTESEHDLAVLNNLSLVYTSFHDKAAIDQCCPLCTRGFESIARTDEFKALIASRINTIPAQKEEMTVAVASAKHRRSRLQNMGPLAAHHASLVSKAVPEAADAIAAAETRVAETKTASATADEAADRAKADHVAAAALAEDADTITRLANEAADIRTAVESLERSFGASQMTQGGGAGGGALGTQGHQARTPSAIAGDIEDVEESKSAVEKEKEGLVRRRERAESELLSLERAAYSLREEHMRAAAKSDRRTQLKRELADIERDEKQADADATRQAAERAPKEAARNHLAAERKGARDRAVAAEAQADNCTRSLQRDLDALDAADRPITDYVLGGKAAALEQLKGSMSATDGRIAECNEQFGMISGRRKTKQDGISKAEIMKRELDDNISYLKGKQEEDRLTAEVDALVLQMHAAGADVGTLEANLRRQVITRDKLRNEYAESQGRVKTHQEAMEGYQTELTDPQYKGVGKKLSKQVVELKTYEMVNQDLDRYHSALDRALMAFHAAKMSDINKVVRALWQRTYRGQDIDYIQIRSDAEGTQGKSSYNYRVVMVVGDAELEMRGRCSAGQKVLACLIIRLALAETFCLNCGILALDEPTTNLDAPNAESLARSLLDIMHSRKDQENFQLIVITHDMGFAHLLGQREHADYYWRITKDDNQHSHIECENIYD